MSMLSASGIPLVTGIRLCAVLSRADGTPYGPSTEGESPSRLCGLPALDAWYVDDPT